jgi:DNA modification methylase
MDGYTVEGECIEVMGELIRHGVTVQSVVTDNPYGIGFLNKKWDNPNNISCHPEVWRCCYDLLPPGGYLLAFAHPRTYHRIACAIADAGFEIRDQILWVYAQGFPKSLNVAKSIDRIAGNGSAAQYGSYRFINEARKGIGDPRKNPPLLDLMRSPRKNPNVRNLSDEQRERWKQGCGFASDAEGGCYTGNADIAPVVSPEAQEWEGWQSNLKPAHEPIVLAQKPVKGTIAANVLKYGTGALNIGACRVPCQDKTKFPGGITSDRGLMFAGEKNTMSANPRPDDMYPLGRWPANFIHDGSEEVIELLGDKARFFYCPKVSPKDRNGSKHPTIKPLSLMRWLVRLVTPPGGLVLDPFAGTGTTGEACILEGFDSLLIERDPEFILDIERRLQKYNGAA